MMMNFFSFLSIARFEISLLDQLKWINSMN